MGKITIQYQRHDKSKWVRNWGLYLFPLLPIWAVVRDNGNAGWLEIDGQFYPMQDNPHTPSQSINLRDGEHTILYRRLRHGFVSQRRREFDDPLTYHATYEKHKLVCTKLTFDPTTRLCLSARGGLFRQCYITTLDRESDHNTPIEPQTPLPDKKKKCGCGCGVILLLAILLLVGVFLCGNGTIPLSLPPAITDTLGIEKDMTVSDWIGQLFHKDTSKTPSDHAVPTAESATTTTTAPALPIRYVDLEGGLRLRTEPNAQCEVILVMPDRSAVQVEKTEGGWCYIIYDGQKGWCKEDYLVDELPITSAEAKRIAEELVERYHDYRHFEGLACDCSHDYVEETDAIRAKAGWDGIPMERDVLEITCCRTIQEATEHLHRQMLFASELSDGYVEYDGKLYFGFYDGKGGFTLDNVKVKSYDSDSIVATAIYSDPGGEELLTFQIQKKNGYWGIQSVN